MTRRPIHIVNRVRVSALTTVQLVLRRSDMQ